MEFVAIDFETANRSPASACQLAAVVVRDGQITEEQSWLIRPRKLYFSPQNIAVHGIKPDDVRDAPEFDRVWSEVESMLRDRVVVAHNASFDIRVLVSSLADHDIAPPHLNFSCTRLISQRAWPGHISYGLAAMAEKLEIQFRHHDALEDSRTCAKVALAAAEVVQAQTFEDLETKLYIHRGRVAMGMIQGPRSIKRSRSEWPSGGQSGGQSAITTVPSRGWPGTPPKVQLQLDPNAVKKVAGDQLPLTGRHIVFTGRFLGLSRHQAMELVRSLGATCEDRISEHTDYLVVGPEDESYPEGAALKINPSDQVSQRDRPVRMLSERQFAQLLPGGQAAFALKFQSRKR